MAALVHDLEGTPDATTVTAGVGGNSNTAGNNFFNTAAKDATGVLEYSSSPVYAGTRALKIRTGSAAVATYVNWNATSRAAVTDDFVRLYLRVDAFPTVNMRMLDWFSPALGYLGGIVLRVDERIGMVDQALASATLSNGFFWSTTQFVIAQWYRLEFKHHADTVNGLITVRIYATPDDQIANFTEEFTNQTVFPMPANTSGRLDIGIPSGNANQPTADTSKHIRLDGIAGTGTDWFGPMSTNRPLRVVRGGMRW